MPRSLELLLLAEEGQTISKGVSLSCGELFSRTGFNQPYHGEISVQFMQDFPSLRHCCAAQAANNQGGFVVGRHDGRAGPRWVRVVSPGRWVSKSSFKMWSLASGDKFLP